MASLETSSTTTSHPPRIVIFFGADGVGKTTQVGLLEKAYKRRGYRVKRCWLRARHSLSYLISKILLLLGYKRVVYQGEIRLLDARTLPEKRVWSLIEFLSIIPLIITRYLIPLQLGYKVIAERFLLDTIVYNQYYIGGEFQTYTRILLGMIPLEATLIHLDANIETLSKRRKRDWPKDFILYQLEACRRLAESLEATSINTSKHDIQDTNQIILESCNLKE